MKSGFAAVIGRPNVGKSTLINSLLGQKIAAVSHHPQTTRRVQNGILTTPDYQIVLVDTPGIHLPKHKLGEFMNKSALEALEETDVILWVVDASDLPHPEDEIVAEKLKEVSARIPKIILLNKTDKTKLEELPSIEAAYRWILPDCELRQISAKTGEGLEKLINRVVELLPEGELIYPEDQVTDQYEREIAAELVREAALRHLLKEVPHCIAVRIDEFKEENEDSAHINATIFVERESQKGIVIGKDGSMIKQIGTDARHEIEAMSGRKIFLGLRVKVNKNWRSDPDSLRLLGYFNREKK